MFTVNETGYGMFRDALARGRPVYTLSNIAGHHMEAICRNRPGFFDGATGLFLSYEIGVRKPDGRIYDHPVELESVPSLEDFQAVYDEWVKKFQEMFGSNGKADNSN